MTLVWTCFEDDVTYLQRSIARRNAAATSLMLCVKSCIFRNNATKDLWQAAGELCRKVVCH